MNKASVIFAVFASIVLVASTSLGSHAQESNFQCSEGMVLVYRINADKYACLKPSSADKWYKEGMAEPVQQIQSFDDVDEAKLPFPEHAKILEVDPEKGYYLEEVGKGVYLLAGSSHHAMFLTTGKGVIAVDAPLDLAEHYLSAIAEVTDEPVTHLIYSHSHKDHIGAANIFSDVEIIAHEETAKTLERVNDPNRPIPTITFEDSYILKVGDKTVNLDYHGAAHNAGNIFIYVPEEKVLMLVDVIMPNWSPIYNLAIAESVSDFIAAHDRVLEYDFEKMVTGHRNLATRDHVMQQKEYVSDMLQNVGLAFQETEAFALMGTSSSAENPPAIFGEAMDTIVEYCEEKTIEKWKGKLAGLDIFTKSHCQVLAFYLMTR